MLNLHSANTLQKYDITVSIFYISVNYYFNLIFYIKFFKKHIDKNDSIVYNDNVFFTYYLIIDKELTFI